MGRAPVTRVRTAPVPALSGTTLTVEEDEGPFLPEPPFPYLIWPVDALPVTGNSERGVVTGKAGDALTLQRGTPPLAVTAGLMFAATGLVPVYELNDVFQVTTAKLNTPPYEFYLSRPDGAGTTALNLQAASGTVTASVPGIWDYRFEDADGDAAEGAFYVKHSEVL